MKKRSKLQFTRTIIQVLGFVFYTGAWASTFNALNQLYLRFTTGSPGVSDLFAYLIEAIAIIPITIIFGRFFCGWLCAFGSLNDFIYSVSSKFFQKKLPAKVDALLKYLKYFVFTFIAIVLWNGLINTKEILSPWDSFARIFIFTNNSAGLNFKISIPTVSIGLILLVMIGVGAAFIERFFCRYLCPLGAFFAVTSKLRIFKIKKPTQNCGSCRSCTNNCPMGIEMFKDEKIGSGECILCMKCTSACPKSNTQLSVYATDISPAIASGLALSAMLGLHSITDQQPPTLKTQTTQSIKKPVASSRSSSNRPATSAQVSNITPSTQTASKYKNGTFSATADGFNGPISSSVTIANDKITSIIVGTNNEYPRYLSRAENTVIPNIISAQSTNVSCASGATYSSNGIKDSVANALIVAMA